MKYAEKAIERASKATEELSKKYSVPTSSIVWIGNNNYIVVKDGKEIRIKNYEIDARFKMKYTHIVLVQQTNGKFSAFVIQVSHSENLISALSRYKNISTATICGTKKEAEETADFWNECYRENGTYLWDGVA